jgi:hypothetical protein
MTQLDLNPKEIREMIMTIKKFISDNHLDELKKANEIQYMQLVQQEFCDFSQRYPTLFKLIILNDDLAPLEKMFKSFSKIKNGSVEKRQEEEKMGYYLADKFFPDDLKNKMHKR